MAGWTTTTSMAFVVQPHVVGSVGVSSSRNRHFSTTENDATTEVDVPFVVEGKNIELTEALMAHVQKRIGGPLKKLSAGNNGIVRECDVVLSVSKNPKVSKVGL
jgi:hypothetical protein